MDHPLDGCRAKLDRASQHFDAIGADFEELTAANVSPVELVSGHVIDDQFGPMNVVRCGRILHELKMEWGIIVGDAMHNIRSALDHLVCRLIDLDGGQITRYTAFPIWDTDPRPDRRQIARFERTIEGIGDVHKTAIRRLQPYRNPGSPESAMLIALAALNNLDKHQVILPRYVVFSSVEDISTFFVTATPDRVDYKLNLGAVLAPGTEIVRFRTHSGQPAQVNLHMAIRTAFGDPRNSVSELRRIRAHCVGIVESFAPAFG